MTEMTGRSSTGGVIVFEEMSAMQCSAFGGTREQTRREKARSSNTAYRTSHFEPFNRLGGFIKQTTIACLLQVAIVPYCEPKCPKYMCCT